MRSIHIYRETDGRYVTEFLQQSIVKLQFKEYVILSHEMMVDWIEKGIIPNFLGA
jgi:hypothetical protein